MIIQLQTAGESARVRTPHFSVFVRFLKLPAQPLLVTQDKRFDNSGELQAQDSKETHLTEGVRACR